MTTPTLSRREMLLASSALFAWTQVPKLALAEGRDPRFLAVILRGALDGLAAVGPVGDPDWIALRAQVALRLDGPNPGLPLDGFFALNPAMPNLHRLYQAGQALIVHAAATPYRERSHFDGQDVLESGFPHPGSTGSGWLNRALATLQPGGSAGAGGKALAIGPAAPLVLRGEAPVMSWTSQRIEPAGEDTTRRLLDLYRHTDPTLAAVLEERLGLAAMGEPGAPAAPSPMPVPGAPLAIAQTRAYFAEAATGAAKLLAQPQGPRVGAVSISGWDTHANEGIVMGPLANLLGALDATIAAFETAMGDAWRDTVIVLATEFGRTARINGNNGTDHGTATVAFVIGGAVKGGRVLADWPGLKDKDLYEKRDLKPTTDLRVVLKGLLRDHLRVDERALADTVFPESAGAKPIDGLVG